MKKLFFAVVSALMAFSCSQYDDTNLTDRVENLENRVTALEKLQTQMDELQTLVKAIQNKDYVTGVTPIMEGGVQVGYAIMFTQSGTVEIRNGRDGVDGNNGKDGDDGKNGNDGAAGKDGSVVSIRQDSDGIWYWTIDGNFTDPKLRVDGATPQFKIDDEAYLCVSYDGKNWERLGKTGATVSSNYKIEYDDDNVYITFLDDDNYKITLPREKNFALSIARSGGIGIKAGETVEIPYVITNADNTVTVETISENGFKAEVIKSSDSEGKIKVAAPEPYVDGKVLVFANKGDKTCMKALHFEAGVFTMSTTAYTVGMDGGEIKMTFTTNYDYKVTIPASASWLSTVSTRAQDYTVTLVAAENTGGARSTEVLITDGNGVELQKVTVAQEAYKEAVIEALFGFQPYTDETHGMTKDANHTMAVIGNYLILSNSKNVAEMPVYDRMTGEYLPNVKVNVEGVDTNREIKAIANDDAGHMIAVAFTSTANDITTDDTVRGWIWKDGIDKKPTSFMWAALGGSKYTNAPYGVNNATKIELYHTVRVFGDLTKDAVIATACPQAFRPVFEFVKDGKLQTKAYVEWPSGSNIQVSLFKSTAVVPMNMPSSVTAPADLEYFWNSGNFRANTVYAKGKAGFGFANPTTHWWATGTYSSPTWGMDAIRINGTTLVAIQNGNYASKQSAANVNQYYFRLSVFNVGNAPDANSLKNGYMFDSREGDLVKGTESNGGPKGTGFSATGITSPSSFITGKTVLGDNDSETGAVLFAPGADGKSVQVYMLTSNQGLIGYNIPFSKF